MYTCIFNNILEYNFVDSLVCAIYIFLIHTENERLANSIAAYFKWIRFDNWSVLQQRKIMAELQFACKNLLTYFRLIL